MPFDGFGLGIAWKTAMALVPGRGGGGFRDARSEPQGGGSVPPDPGGHLETNNITGSQTWVGDDGTRLHGQAAVDKFLQYSDGSSNSELAAQGWDVSGGGGGEQEPPGGYNGSAFDSAWAKRPRDTGSYTARWGS
jgi:hypothetical protein